MLLTKLEIKGFKSFGDKVTINFDKGITGIVGPNGCGKSNVVDSIRWVLGEQKTKALRSEKMENIIFNGTKNRKPQQMTEVSLSFSNTKNLLPTEFSAVTITRRYYRSGDSEYLLNGVTCRLKDITNLFLDTGIASNSYAIIELKMVDDILNDKDNSRRGLFEEAAGISKFKIRKKETLRKLSDTDADLDRVEDLLYEIEKNLRSLERQAKQAERYYKLKEEYKSASVTLARRSVEAYQKNYSELNSKIQQEEDKSLSINKLINESEAVIEKHKTELVVKEKLLSTRQKTLNEHVSGIRQYESDKKIKNERLRFLNDRFTNLEQQIDQDKKSNERAAFSIDSLMKEFESAEKMLAEGQAALSTMQQEYEEAKVKAQSVQEQAVAVNTELKQKQDESFGHQKNLEIKEIQLSTFKNELEKTSIDSSSHQASLAEFDQKLGELEARKKEKEEAHTLLKTRHEDIASRISVTEKTIAVIREELTLVSRKLDAKQNEFNLTKSLVDNLEGFPEAIKYLKKHAKWQTDAPLFSDIITCDEQYRVAIENYLEPYMNYYVVDSEDHAYQAINLLNEAAKGRANFFALSKVEKFSASPAKLFEHAIPATEVIEYDPKYAKLVAFVLDNAYITKSVGDFPDDPDTIFITENGQTTRRKYSISGGSIGLFEGKRIGRAKNLEKLGTLLTSLAEKQEEVKQNLDEKIEDVEKLKTLIDKEALEKASEELSRVSEEYVSVKTRHEQFTQLLDSQTSKTEDIQEKIVILTEEIEALRPLSIDTEQKFHDLTIKYHELSEQLEIVNEARNDKSHSFNQANIEFHQKENKVNSLNQEIQFKQSSYDTSKARIDKNLEELRGVEEEIKKLQNTADTSDQELLDLYEEKESIEGGVNEAEKDYYAARGEIDISEKKSRELLHSKENSSSIKMELQNRLNEVKLALNSIKERLSVEFEINLDELLDAGVEEEENRVDEAELKNNVEGIKKKLENIGPINPMAMEAYNEIQERHVFITGQKEDLIKAKESLMSTIGEIDKVARETFMDAFEKIKENFIKVFRSLFTEEDDCDLSLSDPDNPLDSSIDIIAKPKGKRPLSINQLSGGEKTLTATSLLFSIYLLKPAPFCIFDEVDAPLDDANIDKFNNIIRKFSKESQFIIVTHNKRTMASTDVIYGVTMIEQGVSRVIPVDLRDLE